MVKLNLVLWASFELVLAALSQFSQPPYDTIFFLATFALLLWMTFRSVLVEASRECSLEAQKASFDRVMMEALREQRLNLIEDFERSRREGRFNMDKNREHVFGNME